MLCKGIKAQAGAEEGEGNEVLEMEVGYMQGKILVQGPRWSWRGFLSYLKDTSQGRVVLTHHAHVC